MNRHERRKKAKLYEKSSMPKIMDAFEEVPLNPAERDLFPQGLCRAWRNSLYSAQEYKVHCEIGTVVKLMIRRHDSKAIHSWKHLQKIKNKLYGKERTAVEFYPPESELIDQANMYWLYVLPQDVRLPFQPKKDG